MIRTISIHILAAALPLILGALAFSGMFGIEPAFAQDASKATAKGGFYNPLNVGSVSELLLRIVELLLVFAIPVIVFFIIYGGFLLVTAQGNESQLSKAKTTLTWAVLGGVIVLGSTALVQVIQNTTDAITK